MFSVVVLPDPLGPTSPKISPRRISKLTSSTALKSPKRLVSRWIQTAARLNTVE